jgi:DUF2075 family protein/predicted GIY-YIG superfamily endonuclease
MSNLIEIKKYNFNQQSLTKIKDNHYAKGLWPLVYILSNESMFEAYVGETTDTLSRMSTHLKNSSKNKLTSVRLITSDKFNKSATLDIESNLIKYISGDGKYKLLNGNLGLANHTYYQKDEVYWDIFKTIWSELKSEGVVKNTLDKIDNSDLFKYSPYKTLTKEQKENLIEIIKGLLNNETETIIVEGGAGTGKTIIATFLFKLLSSEIEYLNFKDFGDEEKEFINLITKLKESYPKPKMALIIPMASFRETIKKVFTNIKGLNRRMVIGPAEVANENYDLLFVDESHRLRQRKNLGSYFGRFDAVNKIIFGTKESRTELDWVLKKSKKRILFYDENQSIKPSDVNKDDFQNLKQKSSSSVIKLKSQLRVKGGLDYVSFVKKLLNCQFRKNEEKFYSNEYEIKLFDSFKDLMDQIIEKNKEFGLSRMIAGYAWKWVSKKNKIHDIEIDEIKINWNSSNKDWIHSENSVNEVGCIHTTQGYDLNYAGIIFGKEISYDKKLNKIIINKDNYFDTAGRQGINDPEELANFIKNIYETIMLRGIKGTYVYAFDKDLRDYFKKHIPEYIK